MENYIMISGKKLPLTPEQVAALTAELVKDDPFERRRNEEYYYIEYSGIATRCTDAYCSFDNDCYAVANYCRDEEKMKQRALHEILDRLLWRYSEQHGGDPEWDGHNMHWVIYRDNGAEVWRVECWSTDKYSGPHFCSGDVAEAAIRDVVEPFCAAHPEFVW